MANVGIIGVSVQSGKAFLADLLGAGHHVYGYARPSDHGREVVEALGRQGGVQLDRPERVQVEQSRFIPLGESEVGHDLARLVELADLIIVAHPSTYHEETATLLRQANPRGRRIPIVLSPSRTLATPYLWRILGDDYPILSFQTCPYSCKSPSPGSVYIKRRKLSWIGLMEGRVTPGDRALLHALYPQMLFSDIPATTSLGNIGAVFHPTAYLLNREGIEAAARAGEHFSFYQQGIVHNLAAGKVVGEIDQFRLQLAAALGCSVFGLEANPREDEWAAIMAEVAALPASTPENREEVRGRRAAVLQPIHDSVVSAQHWLDYTYGVHRIPGESLPSAIGRTPTFLERSYPQERYIHEDVPTGLVPLEALAVRLGIPHAAVTRIIDLYQEQTGIDARVTGRNLEPFTTEYLRAYLVGKLRYSSVPPAADRTDS